MALNIKSILSAFEAKVISRIKKKAVIPPVEEVSAVTKSETPESNKKRISVKKLLDIISKK